MFEAIFVSRSIQFHKDMNYHVIDDDNNYSAKSVDGLVRLMATDGSLSVISDDEYSNSFSVIFLEKRNIIGVGLLIDSGVFRILFNEGSIQDFDLAENIIP